MPAVQFLAEQYHHISDEDLDIPELNICSFDIESHSDDVFPSAEKAEHVIPVITFTIKRGHSKKYEKITFGIHEYSGDNEYDTRYVKCSSEEDLLERMYEWFHTADIDVITGWNIMHDSKMNRNGGYDFQYIINRTINLFGEKKANLLISKLSPINKVKYWEDKKTGKLSVDIAGVSIIDYLALYKWYTFKNLESFKLDYVLEVELGYHKLDYSEYGTLSNLYHQNWNLYVDYNIVDTIRVLELEEKLGYIKLAQSLTLLCKIPLKQYSSATSLGEGVMLTYYRRNGYCAPEFKGGQQEWFPAAFVKEPLRGLHEWIFSIDITSSYPTAIITQNMSEETYMGRVVKYKDDNGNWVDCINGRDKITIIEITQNEMKFMEHIKNRKLPEFMLKKHDEFIHIKGIKLDKYNMALEKGLICVAPCGTMFNTKKKGVIATVEKMMFMKRKEDKNKMLEKGKYMTLIQDVMKNK